MNDDVSLFRVITSEGPRLLNPEDGHVLPHEHVIIDMRVYWEGEGAWNELDALGRGLTLETQYAHRHLPQGTSRDNLVMSDWFVAAQELREARDLGCQLVVDLTTHGLDPQPSVAMRGFRLAGMPAVLSVGRYLGHAFGEEQSRLSADELACGWLDEARQGIDGFAVGMIGEIGTSAVISEIEESSLRAAASVQAETGLPMNIHVDPFGRQGHRVLDILESEGAAIDKVALSHCDGDIDIEFLASLAERGAYVEFDLFGTNPEWKIMGRGFNSDDERIVAITRLVELGHAERLLMSHDICMKNSLFSNGGWGFGHLGRSILPRLDELVGQDMRVLLSATNPLRHLTTDFEAN